MSRFMEGYQGAIDHNIIPLPGRKKWELCAAWQWDADKAALIYQLAQNYGHCHD